MEDVNSKILYNGYGLKLLSSSRNRTGVLCKTSKGYKELRKNNISEKNLAFQDTAKRHLKDNGFDGIKLFNIAVDDLPYVCFDGTVYTLEDYTQCEEISLDTEEKLLKAAKTLANMNKASFGFECDIKKSNIGKLPTMYEKRKNELIRIRKWIKSQSRLSELDLIVIKNYDYYMDKVCEAINILNKSKYTQLMEKAKNHKCFCHNSYKEENLRMMPEGELLVQGFNKCAFDYYIMDLADLMRRYIKSEKAEIITINKMIEEYDKIITVTDYDMELIYAVLTYPSKFMKLCNEYYNKRRVYVSDAVVQKMNGLIDLRESNDLILKNIKP